MLRSPPFSQQVGWVEGDACNPTPCELRLRIFGNAVTGTLTTRSHPGLTPNIGPSEVWRFYYYAGSQRIAVRVTSSSQDQLYYLFSDHLGSLHLTVDPNGALHAGRRYYPFGAPRATSPGSLETALTFTGQREQAEIGLFWIGSRWYDGQLGRWAQPDSMVPLESQGVQAWDRFGYTNNNPVKYDDPTGHCVILCAIAIGAAVSLAVDAFVTTQINHQEYSWERAGIALAAGALSGGVGAAIIAPLAAAAGAFAASLAVVPVAATSAMRTGTQLVIGAALAAEANKYISSAQRTANEALAGEKVSFDTYKANVAEHGGTDDIFGAAGYTAGFGMSSFIHYYFPIIPNGLNSNSGQQLFIGAMQSGSQAVSDSSLLDGIFSPQQQQNPQQQGNPMPYGAYW